MQPIAIRSWSWALRSGDRGIYVLESLPPNSTVSPYRTGSCTASTTSYLRGGAPRFEGDKPHFHRSRRGVHSRRAPIQKPGGISQAHFPWASSLSETRPSRPRLSHGATDVYPRRANIPRLFACGQRPTQRLRSRTAACPSLVGLGIGPIAVASTTASTREFDASPPQGCRLTRHFFRWQPT
jgi:hypothetical protein